MAKEDPPSFSRVAEDLIGSLRRLPTGQASRMRKRPTQAVADLMASLVVKHSIGTSSPEQTIRDHWTTIVGHANAAYSHAAQIDPRGKLIVLAAHAVVRNELFLHRAMIVAKLQKLPGCSHVRELHLRAG